MKSCYEICGDGLLLGVLQCDDGNLVDGDGCSSKCRVEKGYDCGAINGTIICRKNYNVSYSIMFVQNNSVLITFSELVKYNTSYGPFESIGPYILLRYYNSSISNCSLEVESITVPVTE